eukprot:gene31564-38148_t
MSVGGDQPIARSTSRDRAERRVRIRAPEPPIPAAPSPTPSRPNNSSYWSRTSFKLTKPKPTKAKYLTRSEMMGICLSVLMSMLIALMIGAFIYIGTPIILKHAGYFLEDMLMLSNLAKGASPNPPRAAPSPSPPLSHLTLSLDQFRTEYLHSKQPVLFTLQEDTGFLQQLKNLLDNFTHEHNFSVHSMSYFLDGGAAEHIGDEYVPARTTDVSLREYMRTPYVPIAPYQHVGVGAAPFPLDALDAQKADVCSEQQAACSPLLSLISSLHPSPQLSVTVSHAHPLASGPPLHAHASASLSLLLRGRKRWVVLPPRSDALGNPLLNLEANFPAQQGVPAEAVQFEQLAGQWVFVPPD